MKEPITRRSALNVMGATIGALTQNNVTTLNLWTTSTEKPSITFPVDSYREYVFILNGERVVVTPQELFDALKAHP